MKNEKSQHIKYPEEEFKDTLHKWIKAVISTVPIIGSSVAEVFSILVNPKLDQRREQFLRDVAVHLIKLSEKIESLRPEKLKDNEIFISTLLQSTSIAIKNHQKEKLEALRNAVINSILDTSVDDSMKLVFISYLDTLTPYHMLILKFYSSYSADSPSNSFNQYYKQYENSVHNTEIDQSIFIHLSNDLISKGLLEKSQSLPGIGNYDVYFLINTTLITQKFLQFISAPVS